MLGDGGGSRTRTYEGLASGFTVRPLCRSGHSPIVSQGDAAAMKRPMQRHMRPLRRSVNLKLPGGLGATLSPLGARFAVLWDVRTRADVLRGGRRCSSALSGRRRSGAMGALAFPAGWRREGAGAVSRAREVDTEPQGPHMPRHRPRSSRPPSPCETMGECPERQRGRTVNPLAKPS